MKRDLRKARAWMRKAEECDEDTAELERRMKSVGRKRRARTGIPDSERG